MKRLTDSPDPLAKPVRTAASPYPAGYKRQKFAKPIRARSEDYLAFVRSKHCCLCWHRGGTFGWDREGGSGGLAIEAAHVSPANATKGMSSKVSDWRAVPLCPLHHRHEHGLDTLGREDWEERFDIDLNEVILNLHDEFLGGAE